MIRIAYIFGKYRHKTWDDGGVQVYDLAAMQREIVDEQYWARVAAECGWMWFAPLSNSVFMEEDSPISGDEFVRRDLAVIRRLTPGYDAGIGRVGWDNESMGAALEHDELAAQHIDIAFAEQGEGAVREFLLSLSSVGAVE